MNRSHDLSRLFSNLKKEAASLFQVNHQQATRNNTNRYASFD